MATGGGDHDQIMSGNEENGQHPQDPLQLEDPQDRIQLENQGPLSLDDPQNPLHTDYHEEGPLEDTLEDPQENPRQCKLRQPVVVEPEGESSSSCGASTSGASTSGTSSSNGGARPRTSLMTAATSLAPSGSFDEPPEECPLVGARRARTEEYYERRRLPGYRKSPRSIKLEIDEIETRLRELTESNSVMADLMNAANTPDTPETPPLTGCFGLSCGDRMTDVIEENTRKVKNGNVELKKEISKLETRLKELKEQEQEDKERY